MFPGKNGRVSSTVAIKDSEKCLLRISIEYDAFKIFHFFSSPLVRLAIYPNNDLPAFRPLGHFERIAKVRTAYNIQDSGE